MEPLYGSPREIAQQMRFGAHMNPWAPGSGGYQHPHESQHHQAQYDDSQQHLDHGPHPEHQEADYSLPLDAYNPPHQDYHSSQNHHHQHDQYDDPYAHPDDNPYEDGLEAMLW